MPESSEEGLRVVPYRELAIEPDIWTVQLRDGRILEVMAHAWTLEADTCVFSLLFKGAPNVDVPVLRTPKDLLADLD